MKFINIVFLAGGILLLSNCKDETKGFSIDNRFVKPKEMLNLKEISKDKKSINLYIDKMIKLQILNSFLLKEIQSLKSITNNISNEETNDNYIFNARVLNNIDVLLINYDLINIDKEILDFKGLFNSNISIYYVQATFNNLLLVQSENFYFGIDNELNIYNLTKSNIGKLNYLVNKFSKNSKNTFEHIYQLCRLYSIINYDSNFGTIYKDSIIKPLSLDNIIKWSGNKIIAEGWIFSHYSESDMRLRFVFSKNMEIEQQPKIILNNRTEVDSISYYDLDQFNDVLANEEIALKVGELILEEYFGKKMEYCYPLQIRLESSKYWVIEGSLPKGYDGGVPYLKLQKSDCKVMQIYHSK